MEYNYLGETGLRVSNLCLGTMTFGKDPEDCSEELSHQILDKFVAKGGNFIDTADIYCKGVSEEIIGRWLVKQPKRNKIILATKLRSVSIVVVDNQILFSAPLMLLFCGYTANIFHTHVCIITKFIFSTTSSSHHYVIFLIT